MFYILPWSNYTTIQSTAISSFIYQTNTYSSPETVKNKRKVTFSPHKLFVVFITRGVRKSVSMISFPGAWLDGARDGTATFANMPPVWNKPARAQAPARRSCGRTNTNDVPHYNWHNQCTITRIFLKNTQLLLCRLFDKPRVFH